MFVLGIEFVVVIRSEAVDELGALLEWLKKVFLLTLSNLGMIPLMPGITLALILYFPDLFLLQ